MGKTSSRLLQSLFVVLALGSAACGDDEEMGDMGSMPTNDVEFIDAMVPHHEMAIEMAGEVVERGARAEVKALAQRIQAAQDPEVATMKAARRELTGSDTVPHMMDDHMEADMQTLRGLSGPALDTTFLREMVAHHAGAAQMAHLALPNLERQDMRTLAERIIADQAREIGEMQRLLDSP